MVDVAIYQQGNKLLRVTSSPDSLHPQAPSSQWVRESGYEVTLKACGGNAWCLRCVDIVHVWQIKNTVTVQYHGTGTGRPMYC